MARSYTLCSSEHGPSTAYPVRYEARPSRLKARSVDHRAAPNGDSVEIYNSLRAQMLQLLLMDQPSYGDKRGLLRLQHLPNEPESPVPLPAFPTGLALGPIAFSLYSPKTLPASTGRKTGASAEVFSR